ncbi:MAG: hypothetical protein P4L64_09575 [Caulobacteraceae bacterium]|nr:hypothetical protein [Caulobacteraceae bacterium]
MSSGGGEAIQPVTADAVARAHQALLRQTDLQFAFSFEKPPEPPDWAKAFGRWLGHVIEACAPAMKFVFWGGLALILAAVLYFVLREVVGVRLGGKRKVKARPVDLDADWRPAAARARTLLEDADRLAAEGRFEEAVHLLLFRSIEDIDARWPRLIQPALTSRDIAVHATLPPAARETFSAIARTVEASYFGGRAVGSADFAACRAAYEAFALPARS